MTKNREREGERREREGEGERKRERKKGENTKLMIFMTKKFPWKERFGCSFFHQVKK